MRYLTFAFFFISSIVVSQNYKLVDKTVSEYPQFHSLISLSNKIKNDFKKESEKARAAYTWIAINIDYDIEAYKKPKPLRFISYKDDKSYKETQKKYLKRKIDFALISKKALCEGYSAMFVELCNLLNLESRIVKGISRVNPTEINSFKTTKNHAWNTVKVNNKWHLLDITWSSGFMDPKSGKWIKSFNDFYYFTKPEHFITSHYPQYDRWQLLDNPISLTSFYQKPIFYAHYYKSKLKLNHKHKGNIKVTENEIILFFDKKSNKERLHYSLLDDKYVKHLRLKKIEGNTYQARINYKSNTSNILTLYVNLNPIINFTVN
ncbi:transglutaminase domain-containing protein [Pontimicrobium aquaticum]|uniref:Transglutaminase-like domain-containing protein n=1 Tax=Pontimicrobium aquaticum TaxID=2565367 RepID=A0A4U0EWP1_9FLAO|nr:transglutaminase domain-containing protein [Pontimicrobium aquaticum]TJY36411.1 hypothetical protein E5167_07040 [Pontimicrobium aquaticum]